MVWYRPEFHFHLLKSSHILALILGNAEAVVNFQHNRTKKSFISRGIAHQFFDLHGAEQAVVKLAERVVNFQPSSFTLQRLISRRASSSGHFRFY